MPPHCFPSPECFSSDRGGIQGGNRMQGQKLPKCLAKLSRYDFGDLSIAIVAVAIAIRPAPVLKVCK